MAIPDIKRIQADDEGDFLEISQGCLSPSKIMLEAVCTDDGEETHVQLALPYQSAHELCTALHELLLKCILHIADNPPVDFASPIEIPTKDLQDDYGNPDPNAATTRRHFIRNHLTLLPGRKRNPDIPEHGN